ncbi:hypothetical protein ABZT08_20740, partial [Streptomyces sp. NPDC005526]|uniref:hypothetical protein n=1 Tax=Streptomyces sp. NPDC005526 TaxID=3156885 RepID=UPI0033BB8E4F
VYAPAVKEVSAKFPKITFGIIDDNTVQSKNVPPLGLAPRDPLPLDPLGRELGLGLGQPPGVPARLLGRTGVRLVRRRGTGAGVRGPGVSRHRTDARRAGSLARRAGVRHVGSRSHRTGLRHVRPLGRRVRVRGPRFGLLRGLRVRAHSVLQS